MNDNTLAYLAGIVDGEGSIMIRKSVYRLNNPKYNDCVNPSYSPRITIKNTCEAPLKLMQKTLGGSYYKDKKIYQSKNSFHINKVLFCYGAEHRIAYNIINVLLPFLLIKKQQAKKLIQLVKLKEKYSLHRDKSKKGFNGKPYTLEAVKAFDKLYMEVKKLNK